MLRWTSGRLGLLSRFSGWGIYFNSLAFHIVLIILERTRCVITLNKYDVKCRWLPFRQKALGLRYGNDQGRQRLRIRRISVVRITKFKTISMPIALTSHRGIGWLEKRSPSCPVRRRVALCNWVGSLGGGDVSTLGAGAGADPATLSSYFICHLFP